MFFVYAWDIDHSDTAGPFVDMGEAEDYAKDMFAAMPGVAIVGPVPVKTIRKPND